MKMMRRSLRFSSLRMRLGLLILLAILPMSGLMLYTYMEERNFAISNVEGDVQQFAGFVSAFQEQLIEGTRQLLVALAKHPGVQDQDPLLCSRHFSEMSEEYSRYANMGWFVWMVSLFVLLRPCQGRQASKLSHGFNRPSKVALCYRCGSWRVHLGEGWRST